MCTVHGTTYLTFACSALRTASALPTELATLLKISKITKILYIIKTISTKSVISESIITKIVLGSKKGLGNH